MNFIKKITQKIMNIAIVKKIIEIPLVKKLLNRETISYLIFGVLTTIVNYVVYILSMLIFNVSENDGGFLFAVSASTVIAWIFAVAFAYITNKLYVFQSKSFELKLVLKDASAFIGARLFSLGCEVVWMAAVVSPAIGMNDKIAKILANVFIIIINYFFSKMFIFKKKK